MAEQNNYLTQSIESLEQQEAKDTYYIPKLQQTIEAGEYSSERDIEIKALKKIAGKNNNAFLMGMRNLDETVPVGLFDGYLESKAKEKGWDFTGSTLGTVGEGIKGVATAPIRFTGYAATNSLPLIAKTATSLYAISGAAGGVESADKFVREANKGIEAWTKEVQRITGIEDSGAVESIVGNALGSVWGSVAIAGAAGGAAVAPMFGISAAQDTYTRQREKETGKVESLARATIHGTGEWYLEKLQFNRIFGALSKKSKPIAIIKSLLENSVQEGLQQATELGANWNIDNRKLTEKLQEVGASMVGGAVASLGGSVGGNILNRKTINEVGDLMKKTGHTDEEIQTVKENLNKIVDTDELQQAANMVAKDELTTIALTYKEQAQAMSEEIVNQLDGAISRNELVGDTEQPEDMPPLYQLGEMEIDTQKNPSLGRVLYQAEQDGNPFQTLGQVLDWTKGKLNIEKAKQLSVGVGSVYSQTYEQLKALGQNEQLADSNARIRSAMAFSIANTYGVGVEEANKMLGGITSQRASEFKEKQIDKSYMWEVKDDDVLEYISKEPTASKLQEVAIKNLNTNDTSELIAVRVDDGRWAIVKKDAEVYPKYQDVAQRINEIDEEEKAKGVPEYTAPTININGVERQTTNSEGNPIAKSEKSLRYFYDWFGDSKVVDEKGRPLVVYHGTKQGDFSVFDKSKIGSQTDYGYHGIGFYLTPQIDLAESYSKDWQKYRLVFNPEGRIMPLYSKIENPYVMGTEEARKFKTKSESQSFTNKLKEAGYDGILVEIDELVREREGELEEVIAFEPNQIKSIDNRGTFSGSEDIYYQPAYAGSRVDQEQAGTPQAAYYNNMTYLFENANESSFPHEQAHAYMDVLQKLSADGNKQAQSDLETIRKWLGKKQGEQFTTPDWERFARGFEMYLREGKAPNKYLGGKGGVFERFKNWLLNIYAGIKYLTITNEQGKKEPVRINKQIKDFYDEMLGGVDIDSVIYDSQKNEQALETLQNKLQELSAVQQKLAEERALLVRAMADGVKPETTWANVKDWGKNVLESAKELPTNVLQSSYARLSKIDKRLGLLVQKVEQSQGLRIKRWTDQIKPFYEAFNNLSADDKAKVQFYLLNQQWGDVEDILGKENTDAVHDMLKTIYDELIESGVEVGYRDNYFPRSVLDYDGLLQEMGLTYPQLRKEMEDAIGKDATPEEQAEWLDKHIMGFKGNVSTKGNKYTKERKLDLITDSMARYYRPSMETLVNYVEGMAKLLSMREAFGKDITYKEDKESAEDSIGKIINRLFGNNELSKKEVDEVRQVLSALYLPNGMGNKFLQAMRQYGYATKLSYSTTVRQFADIGMMMKVNGVLNTLNALFHPDKRITLENLGIDPLGEEFKTSKKDIGGMIANISTKWKGINWADAIMKNAFMRGSYKSLQDLAKKPEKFHEKYDSLFGDETDTLIKDLNDNKVSEPVKVLLFHEISKIQPISRSAMPTAYLSNPNGRVFYMFKTFSLHRAEYMVSELANDFRNKDFKKAGKDIMADVAVIGWEGLVEILIAFLKYGWQAFAAKEVLDTFAGSGLGVFGLNKHQALQLTRGQVGDFFQEMVGVGTPLDDIGYMIRHYDDEDKLLRAFLPDMIVEPLLAGPKEMSKKKIK